MKKLALLALGLFTLTFQAQAAGDKPVKPEQLPAPAKEFVAKYFPGVKIASVKQDMEYTDRDYDVTLANQAEIEFNRKGLWKKVDCGQNAVPQGIVPQPIMQFVRTNHPGTSVVEIEREGKGGYQIQLNNDTEIKFNDKFKARYDD